MDLEAYLNRSSYRKLRYHDRIAQFADRRPLDGDPRSCMDLHNAHLIARSDHWPHIPSDGVETLRDGYRMFLTAASQKHIRPSKASKGNFIYLCAFAMKTNKKPYLLETVITKAEIAKPKQGEPAVPFNRTFHVDDEQWEKPDGAQLLVDEVRDEYYIILYRRRPGGDKCMVTTIQLMEDDVMVVNNIIPGAFRDDVLEFNFGLDFNCILAVKANRDIYHRPYAMDYLIPHRNAHRNNDIVGPFFRIAFIPRIRLESAVEIIEQKPEPTKVPMQFIDIMRRSGKLEHQYLGKMKSWRFYAELIGSATNRVLDGIIAITRIHRNAKCIILGTGLTEQHFAGLQKIWKRQHPEGGRVVQGEISMLSNGKFLHRQFFGIRNGDKMEWLQWFYMIGEMPAEMVKKCAQCKKSEDVQLKACRICKAKDHHLQWWKYPCHFCSAKCFKASWNQHKKLH